MGRGGWRPGGGRPPGIKETKPRRRRKARGSEEHKQPENKKPDTGSVDLEAGEFLRQVWNDPNVEISLRIRAAEIAFRVLSEKQGKKSVAAERAKIAGKGRFAAGRPPLSIVK